MSMHDQFDVTMGWSQSQGYFQRVYCNITDHILYRPYTICGVANTYNKPPEKRLILQSARSDVNIDLARADGNRLKVFLKWIRIWKAGKKRVQNKFDINSGWK